MKTDGHEAYQPDIYKQASAKRSYRHFLALTWPCFLSESELLQELL